MPIYEYKCRRCGLITVELTNEAKPTCELCGKIMGRKFSFYVEKPFQPHYNPSVGSYVSSRSEFQSRLHSLSEEATLRTGIEHNYVEVDQGDREAFAVDDTGMESYYRNRHNKPITESLD